MPGKIPNIVQAEFFHVTSTSIDEVMEECAERIEEGSKIKTVVRFYDRENIITSHVQKLKLLDVEFTDNIISFQESGWIGRQLLRLKFWWAGDERRVLKRALIPLLRERLSAELCAKEDIALECEDRSFRMALPEELHEL